GWAVVTFHYTGSWGSGGTFALQHGYADADALRRQLANPEVAKRWGVDPDRVLLVGHSYGGAVAAHAGRDPRGLLGAPLRRPWDSGRSATRRASGRRYRRTTFTPRPRPASTTSPAGSPARRRTRSPPRSCATESGWG